MTIQKTIDKESTLKLYIQVYSIIKEKIESGELPDGSQIPTEDELCKTYDVSKITVREAIHELVREGYLRRQQGKGTFVTYSVPHPGLIMETRLSEDMYGEGVTIEKEILERGVRKPFKDVKTFLMTEQEIYYVLYKKVVDGQTYIEELYVPLFIIKELGGEDIFHKSFFELIEERGTNKISKVVQTLEIKKIKGDIAVLLKVKEGSHTLVVNSTLISSQGTPIAFIRIFWEGGKSKIQMEFERTKWTNV
jgi:GntR family transcriptional regulator